MVVNSEECTPLADDEVPVGDKPLIGIVEPSNVWTEKRDNLAQEMWNDFRPIHEH